MGSLSKDTPLPLELVCLFLGWSINSTNIVEPAWVRIQNPHAGRNSQGRYRGVIPARHHNRYPTCIVLNPLFLFSTNNLLRILNMYPTFDLV